MTADPSPHRQMLGGRAVARVVLAAFMVVAGVGHFVAHEEFLKQVPTWMPARSAVVWLTGVIEVVLGAALVAVPRRRVEVGWALAGFFVAVFPGNVYQAVAGTDAFGLGPTGRWVRLAFQPALIALALWSTGPPGRRPRRGG